MAARGNNSIDTMAAGENIIENSTSLCSNFISTNEPIPSINESFSHLENSDVFNYIIWPMLICLSGLGSLSNVFIFVTICFSKTFRRPVNYLIGNLAFVSTLFVISVFIRFQSERKEIWNYSTVLCKILPALQRFPISLEAFSVTIISLDRSKVVLHPLSFETKYKAIRKIYLTWLLAFIIEIPRGMYSTYNPAITKPYKCIKKVLFDSVPLHISYAVIYLVVVYIIPAIVMIKELSKLHSHLKYLSFCKTHNAPNASKGIRLVKNAFILTVIFMVFHIPIGLLYFPMAVPKHILSDRIVSYLPLYRDYLFIVAYFHGAIYSVLIFVTSNELRDHICGRFPRCNVFVS